MGFLEWNVLEGQSQSYPLRLSHLMIWIIDKSNQREIMRAEEKKGGDEDENISRNL